MLIYSAAMVNATPTYNIYMYIHVIYEYVPITVIILTLSEMVLLDILSEVPRLQHFLTKDGCADQANTHKKDNLHRIWDTFQYQSIQSN